MPSYKTLGSVVSAFMVVVGGTASSGGVQPRRCSLVIFAVVIVLFTGIFLMALNLYELHHLLDQQCAELQIGQMKGDLQLTESCNHHHCRNPVAWIRSSSVNNPSSLPHVRNVFTRLGYELVDLTDEQALENDTWDVLWSHNYPFKKIRAIMKKLRPHQRVNHFPGSGFISSKVNLASTGLPSIPRAFRMPNEREEFLKYAYSNPALMFVQKSSNHRGIRIKKIDDLDLNDDETFIQEFIHNPLLIDGHKFDIGVYTVMTSINPLRVYVYDGDVLFRFCPDKYHPFDPDVPDKYVIGDDYLPIWKVPSLRPFYLDGGLGMKNSFNVWLTSQGKNPDTVWNSVLEAIQNVFYAKEALLVNAASRYPSTLNFFEMMRFDFVVDDTLQVHLMEANMSPNLSSAHFKENRLLYEQVIFNLLSVVGIGSVVHSRSLKPRTKEEEEMQVAMKDLVVFPEHCKTNCGRGKEDCDKNQCQLCRLCLTPHLIEDLKRAYLEHVNKLACLRAVPAPVSYSSASHPSNMSHLTPENTLMTEWFRGKCLINKVFCS